MHQRNCIIMKGSVNAAGLWQRELGTENGVTATPARVSSPTMDNNQSMSSSSVDRQNEYYDLPPKNVKTCLEALSLPGLLNRSCANARVLLTEYRKVIPQNFLHNHLGHCWNDDYSIEVLGEKTNDPMHTMRIVGNIGDVQFNQTYNRKFEAGRLDSVWHKPFSAQTVCLPNIFIAGFMKCGSTFLDCFVSKLVQASLSTDIQLHASKEPRFWVEPFESNAISIIKLPTAADLGGYIANFAQGMKKAENDMQTLNASRFIMMDGSSFYLNSWPVYHMDNDPLTNICILPSTIPLLLPRSMYIVIMREPVNALYSSFWYLCTMYNRCLPRQKRTGCRS